MIIGTGVSHLIDFLLLTKLRAKVKFRQLIRMVVAPRPIVRRKNNGMRIEARNIPI